MKNIFLLSLFFLFCSTVESQEQPLVLQNFKNIKAHLDNALDKIGNAEQNPGLTDKDGNVKLVSSKNWISGFFPGCLWYAYEYSKDEKFKVAAQHFTKNVEAEQFNATTHDMGFKIYCSFGNGYRLTNDSHYKDVIIQSAKTLITRFNPKTGCIRSWDHNQDKWQFPVIIDNMMNLELLFEAAKLSGDSIYYKIAVTHANTTLKNHFRNDYSTWHVVNYDTATGAVISKVTAQGYSDESCWARGEAWGLYGYTMCYRETKDKRYLEQAKKIAEYVLTNKNLPEDMVPYWDYNAPNIPNEERDASAGAIMCSAFYELSVLSDKNNQKYKAAADKILATLSSPAFSAAPGTNGNFILMHSVGARPKNSDVNVPLIYADYYFIEANLRKMNIDR